MYVREIKRQLKVCINEHKKNIEGSESKYTGLTRHRLETGHNFNYNEVRILATERVMVVSGEVGYKFINRDVRFVYAVHQLTSPMLSRIESAAELVVGLLSNRGTMLSLHS
ncbi:hypothetical protein DD595_25540 [Enterobacter cloacae complex sp. 4DZ3-17B2]|nr:hypothetical protein DD595_25540 [Enterobacter cloacae complex sp. 4DZ3-17B2]